MNLGGDTEGTKIKLMYGNRVWKRVLKMVWNYDNLNIVIDGK
ncbi:hypothetical protein [Bacillus badius]|nr:hypothetical protein [Bacillus badius]